MTDALTSGVNGLNLSVEDFQNVAAQLLHSQKAALTAVDDVAGTSMESSVEEKMASTDLEIPVQAFSLVNSGVVRYKPTYFTVYLYWTSPIWSMLGPLQIYFMKNTQVRANTLYALGSLQLNYIIS